MRPNHEYTCESMSIELMKDKYQSLSTEYDENSHALWLHMLGEPRPSFTWTLVNDLQAFIGDIQTQSKMEGKVEYLVGASLVNGVFNLGGDLVEFINYIKTQNKNKLQQYAYATIQIGYAFHNQLYSDITTIALVEGNCYGGGFEAALSCNVLIAEESAKFCFPEVTFNLFPGMGAYSFLARKVSPHVSEKLITSGNIYTGKQLYDLGVVDVCAADGEGKIVTANFIEQHRRQRHARLAMHKVNELVRPIDYAELKNIVDVWVETALRLDERAIRIMERFARAQAGKQFTKQEAHYNKIVSM